MAKVRTSMGIDRVRGPVGPLSYGVRLGTGRVRMNGGVRRQRTESQLSYRAVFSQVSKAWGGLTDAQRLRWREWAADYGTDADPDAVSTVSGYARFVGANTLLVMDGEPVQVEPFDDGTGNAEPALVDLFPIEGTDKATVSMIHEYPPTKVNPATAYLFVGPNQRLTRPSNSRRRRFVESFDVTGGGPGFDGGPITVTLNQVVDRGSMLWFRTRVLTGAGNTSSYGEWPVRMPPLGELRVFRLRPIFFILAPQRLRVEPTKLVVEMSAIDPFDTVIEYAFADKNYNTVQKLHDAIVADGLWSSLNLNADVSSRDSADIVPFANRSLTPDMQGSLVTITEI